MPEQAATNTVAEIRKQNAEQQDSVEGLTKRLTEQIKLNCDLTHQLQALKNSKCAPQLGQSELEKQIADLQSQLKEKETEQEQWMAEQIQEKEQF